MRRSLLGLFVSVSVMTLGTPAVAVPNPVSIQTSSSGTLSGDGLTATVEIRVRCSPEGDVLEALVTVSQEQTFAQASFGLICDGSWHRISVSAVALDVPFAAGPAQVSPFILICDGTGNCVQGQDTRVVRLR
jgi:hypothetical protein